jgi:guanylate kinase
MIERGEFLEWAEVHGHLYGTSRSQIEKAIREGKDVLLDIDTQGAINIKNQIKDAVLIFILPPSWEELERRLKLRGTENQEEIKKRLKTAREEVKKINFYDYVIVNDEIQKAFEQLKSIIIAERCRTSRFELLKFKQKVDSM